ncbi:MAG: hypothetical protein AAGC85_21625, partial [Bacteroidota bacterium]
MRRGESRSNRDREDGLWEGHGLFVLVFCFVFNKENEEEGMKRNSLLTQQMATYFKKEVLQVLHRLPRAFHISPVTFFFL